jgi:hypothetical protein
MEKLDISGMDVTQLEALCFRLVEQQAHVKNNLDVAQAALDKKRHESDKSPADDSSEQ